MGFLLLEPRLGFEESMTVQLYLSLVDLEHNSYICHLLSFIVKSNCPCVPTMLYLFIVL